VIRRWPETGARFYLVRVPCAPGPPRPSLETRLRRLVSCAPAACLLALGTIADDAPAARAASASRGTTSGSIELRGRVTQSEGAPLARARMTLRVTRATTVTCDDSGHFRMTLHLPSVATLERGPWIAQLDGAARGWRLMHAEGEPSLGIELSLDRATGAPRVVARSNDERFAALAAAAVARSEARTLEGVRFLGMGGERSNIPPAPNMAFVAAVAIEDAPPPAPAVVAPPPAARTPRVSRPALSPRPKPSPPPRAKTPRTKTADSTAMRRDSASTAGSRDVRRDEPATPDAIQRRADPDDRVHPVDPEPPLGPSTPPVVPRVHSDPPEPPGPLVNPRRPEAPPDPRGCSCRLDGTVELVRSTVLDQPEEIVIRLEEWPAVADTVELYMGAPRSFRLSRVPCGSRRVAISRLDPLLPPARIVTGQAMRGFGCASGELVQPRIVIALDRGRRRR